MSTIDLGSYQTGLVLYGYCMYVCMYVCDIRNINSQSYRVPHYVIVAGYPKSHTCKGQLHSSSTSDWWYINCMMCRHVRLLFMSVDRAKLQYCHKGLMVGAHERSLLQEVATNPQNSTPFCVCTDQLLMYVWWKHCHSNHEWQHERKGCGTACTQYVKLPQSHRKQQCMAYLPRIQNIDSVVTGSDICPRKMTFLLLKEHKTNDYRDLLTPFTARTPLPHRSSITTRYSRHSAAAETRP